MNVKENLQCFLWSVKRKPQNNKGKKNSRKRKLFVPGESCNIALAELGSRRGHLRKMPWPKSGVRR